MAPEVSLLDRLGGRDGLAAAVANLYARLLDDPRVAGYFDDVDLVSLRAHMVEFLLAALSDDPRIYTGRDLTDAHAHLGVTDDVFDRVVAHIADAVRAAGADDTDNATLVARIAPLRPQIVIAGD